MVSVLGSKLLLPSSLALRPHLRRAVAGGSRQALFVRSFREERGREDASISRRGPERRRTRLGRGFDRNAKDILAFPTSHTVQDLLYDIQRDMDSMRRWMMHPDQLIGATDRLANEMFRPITRAREPARDLTVDIEETDESYIIKIDVPGMTKDDVSISVSDDYLTISMERSSESESETEEGEVIVRERRYGRFRRVLQLPDDADNEDISAKVVHGELTVTMPKLEAESDAGRTITVQGTDEETEEEVDVEAEEEEKKAKGKDTKDTQTD